MEVQRAVGAFEMAGDDGIIHGLPPECAKMFSAMSVFVPTLTCSVGHCWAIHPHARSP